MTVRQLIDAIDSGKTLEIESTFEALMADKVATKLDAYRQEVAKSMFASQVAEEKDKEDDEDEDEDDDKEEMKTVKEDLEDLEEASNSLVHYAVKMAAHHVDHATDEDPNAHKKIEKLHQKITASHGKEVADAVRKNAHSESQHNTTSTAGNVPGGHDEFVKKHLGGHGSPEHKAYIKKMNANHMDSQSQ